MNRYRLILLIILCAVIIGSYFIINPIAYDAKPSVMRVGILPDQSKEVIHNKYEPLLQYLKTETGLEFELVMSSSYDDLLKKFVDEELDMAFFGGFTFVQAYMLGDAKPLVMRDIDTRFTSLFLVRQDNPAQNLFDLKAKRLSFGSRLSTSGHLMPRYFMQQEKSIVAEEFFSEVVYSGAHDKTVYQVRDAKADVGAVNALVFREMVKDGRVDSSDFRLLWETPPYPDYVWAVHDHLNEETLINLRDAFLKLNNSDVVHAEILERMGAGVMYPAGIDEFLPLKKIAESMDLFK